jgi:hypothetical protein
VRGRAWQVPDRSIAATVATTRFRGISPLAPLFVVVVLLDLIAVPYGRCCDRTELWAVFTAGLTDEVVNRAFWYTAYAVFALWALSFLLGTRRDMRAYQQRRADPLSHSTALACWWAMIALSWCFIAVFFVQAGFQVPVLESLGQEYLVYALLRTETRELVNQGLFSIALYLLATPALILAFSSLRKARYVAVSIVTLLAVASFTLARSPLALTGLIFIHFALLSRPRSLRILLPGALVFAAVLIGNHMISKGPEGYSSLFEYLLGRVVYGEWAALPRFLDLFASDAQPLRSILPAGLQALLGGVLESPARLVMIQLVPMAVQEGTAGVANTFFIGDAFAVAGFTGVLLAPIWVALQYRIVARCFLIFPKNFFTTCLYSWILFKMLIAVVGGFSAFLISSMEVGIVLLAYSAAAVLATRAPILRRQVPAS